MMKSPKDKYPLLSAEFESRNVKGLYYAGTLMHGYDKPDSTGGFIHGFRYAARWLGRRVASKYGHAKMASQLFDIPRDFGKLHSHLAHRCRTSGGIYQLFNV